MKNQYVGDIGDYGKYALLQVFCNNGIKVGVNWYLTKDDSTTDGRFTDYLKEDDLRFLDKELFKTLKKVAFNKDGSKREKKSVNDVKKSNYLKGAEYYSEELNPVGTPAERVEQRNNWFNGSIAKLNNCELIFMDPDNGLLKDNNAKNLNAEKYVLPDEIEKYYSSGKNVVYYCHKGRRKTESWNTYKNIMSALNGVKLITLTYHRGTQRSYIFAIHKECYERYNSIIEAFLKSDWGIYKEKGKNIPLFTRE